MAPLEHNSSSSRWNGLQTRVISGVVMAVIVLGALWLGGFALLLLITVAGLLMLREWDALTKESGAVWHMAGLLYVALPCASLIWLRGVRFENTQDAPLIATGLALVLYVLFAVWATDIGAYFTGRKIGGPKLAPRISPGKTWAGLGGGIVAAAIAGALCTGFSPYPITPIIGAGLAAMLAIIGQIGDLFESWLKRRVGMKDSGTLIPGHGGILDRVDGLIFTLPLFALLVALSGRAI